MVPEDTVGHVLLICTVGGSPEPILKSIEHWSPARVCLLHSPDTRPKADDIVRDSPLLTPGNTDYHTVTDPQDLVRCVEEMRRLTGMVEAWCGRGEACTAVVDLTGGHEMHDRGPRSGGAPLALHLFLYRRRQAVQGGGGRGYSPAARGPSRPPIPSMLSAIRPLKMRACSLTSTPIVPPRSCCKARSCA